MQLDQKNNELRNVIRIHPYFKSLVNRKNNGWAWGLKTQILVPIPLMIK